MPEVSEPNDLSARDVLARYPALRDDHLRYLEQWGLVRPAKGARAHPGPTALPISR